MQKHDSVNEPSRETLWRGALTPGQRKDLNTWLAAHPEERDAWVEEVALTRVLTRLPDSDAPSNLTARVLDQIDREAMQPRDTLVGSWMGWLRKMGWVPRLAGVAVLVMAGYLGHHQYQRSKHAQLQRAELARNVAEVTQLADSVPSLEALQDFTAIRSLESAALPDEKLLALLQ